MTFDAARARNALDAIHALAAMVIAATPVKLRLMTAVGSATTNGTELASGGSYVAGTGLAVAFGAATSPSTSNNSGATSQTNMPAATITGIEVWDSAGTPVRQELGTLTTPKTTVAGDTLSFNAAAITSTLA